MKKTKQTPAQKAASILGSLGRGASKRRNVDYADLAKKSHAARRAKKSGDNVRSLKTRSNKIN